MEGGPTPGPDSCTLAAPSLGADSITIAARQGEDADALQIPVIIPPQLYYQINDGVQAGILNQLICTLDRVSTDLACSSGGTRVYFLKETVRATPSQAITSFTTQTAIRSDMCLPL